MSDTKYDLDYDLFIEELQIRIDLMSEADLKGELNDNELEDFEKFRKQLETMKNEQALKK